MEIHDAIMDDMRSMGMDDKMIDTVIDSPYFDSEMYWMQKNVLEGLTDIESLPQDGPSYHKLNNGPDGRIMETTGEVLGDVGKMAAVVIPGFIIAGMAAKLATQDAMAFTQSHNAPALNPDLNPADYNGTAPLLPAHNNAPMSPDDDPAFDSAYVVIQKLVPGNPIEQRVDTVGIHPFYYNTVMEGGPLNPYHGTWIFKPDEVLINSHAHWYNGGGDPTKGFNALPEAVKVEILGPDYEDYFDNGGAPDTDEEVVSITSKNWPGNDDNPVPVELSPGSFIAMYNNGIELNWKTETEVQNYGFEIYRDILDDDGNVVSPKQKIGFVEGHGNSNSPKFYTFKDPNENLVLDNIRRYNLKQIDNDGTTEEFPSIEVLINNGMLGPLDYDLSNPYPNPFNPSTSFNYTVSAPGQVNIAVYNSVGELVQQIVNEHKEPGKYKAKWEPDNAPSGVYFLYMGAPNFKETNKIILLR